jgi:quercetin dioxygenase-like cupin family protein
LEDSEFEKSKSFIAPGIIEYTANSIVFKTILGKLTGNVSVGAFDAGQALGGRVSPFDNLIQVIEGEADVIINGASNLLKVGESIVIPAHSRNAIRAKIRMKIVSTLIKNGYEELS